MFTTMSGTEMLCHARAPLSHPQQAKQAAAEAEQDCSK